MCQLFENEYNAFRTVYCMLSMVCNLKGKVVFVSGARSGIGRDAAVAFAKAQCCVVLNGRNRLNLEETARLCLGTGGVTRDQVCVLLYLLSVCRSVNSNILSTCQDFGGLL